MDSMPPQNLPAWLDDVHELLAKLRKSGLKIGVAAEARVLVAVRAERWEAEALPPLPAWEGRS